MAAPNDVRSALEWAVRLQELTPADRAAELAAPTGPESPSGGWFRLLQLLFDEEHGPTALAMWDAVREMGISAEEAPHVLAPFVSLPFVQQGWSRWTRISDRSELRLRLELLYACDEIDEALTPFLGFFFRASDTVLYPAAAVTIGRHLKRSPALQRDVQKYAAERRVALDRPIVLAGLRSSRRLLLTLAAAAADTPPPGEAALPIPVTDDLLRDPLSLAGDPSDLSVVLHALDVLWTSEATRARVEPLVDAFLSAVPHAPSRLIDRRVIQRWGMLFVSRETSRDQTEETLSLWRRALHAELQRAAERSPHDFAGRMSALYRLDELMQSVSFLVQAQSEAILNWLTETLDGDEGFFCILRVLIAVRRRYGNLPEWTSQAKRRLERDAPAMRTNGLASAWRVLSSADAAPGALLGRVEYSLQAQFVADLLRPLQIRAQWLSQVTPQRALSTFFLLDEVRRSDFSPELLGALWTHAGLTPSASRLDKTEASVRVVLRLLSWESPGAEEFIDAQVLQQIEELDVLLAMVPSGRSTPLMPQLADAFEHQFRWRLERDPEFEPDLFLYLLTVRNPDPSLFRYFLRLLTNRTYERRGEIVPAQRWLQSLHTVAQRTRALSEGAGEAHAFTELNEVPTTAAGECEARFFIELRAIRHYLTHVLQQSRDVRGQIRSLGQTLLEAGPGKGRTPALITLLRRLHRPHQPVLQSGYPAWSSRPLHELESLLHEIALTLVRHSESLLPVRWDDPDDAIEAVGIVQTQVRACVELLCGPLPYTEETLIRAVCHAVRSALSDWHDAVLSTASSFLRVRENPGAATWQSLFEHVCHIWNAPVRIEVLLSLWRGLLEHIEMSWEAQGALLVWAESDEVTGALDEAERGPWQEAVAALYVQVLRRSMELKEEGRVLHLLTSPDYEALRRHPQVAGALDSARVFCFDRYRLGAAYQARRDAQIGRGAAIPSRLKELSAFTLHFSTVWIGLLVGAFLMLDFGEAWTAMAEVDDRRGIALTFLLGIVGTFLYLFSDLRRKVSHTAGESRMRAWAPRLSRLFVFLTACLGYTLLSTGLLWFLLSGTEEVVHGPGAIGHIVVWSGFALLVGTFFGIIAKRG